jgi:hypothetical protein
LTRLAINDSEIRPGESGLVYECDGCGRLALAREPSSLLRSWLPERWLETVPADHRKWAGPDDDVALHWCPSCQAIGAWEGVPRDLDCLPTTDRAGEEGGAA